MKILDRYLLGEFLSYLTLSLIGFIVIFVVVDLFQKIDVFLDHKAPAGLVIRFYLYRAPEVVVLVLPVALLLATFLALGQLNKFGELTAMRAAGRSLLAILTKRLGVRPPGWEDVVPNHPTLGDVDSPEALERYQDAKRAYKASLKAARAAE